MVRLTKRTPNGVAYIAIADTLSKKEQEIEGSRPILEGIYAILQSLAAYEDTELTPEEFIDLKVCLEDEGDVRDLIELMQYRKLEAEGKLIKTPCKVGDTVYVDRRILFLPYAIGCTKKIVECDVISFIQTKKQRLLKLSPHGLDCYIGRASNKRVAVSAIGKTVFLTREEAEKALEVKK